jgi:hypothetical protein
MQVNQKSWYSEETVKSEWLHCLTHSNKMQ